MTLTIRLGNNGPKLRQCKPRRGCQVSTHTVEESVYTSMLLKPLHVELLVFVNSVDPSTLFMFWSHSLLERRDFVKKKHKI